MTLDRFAQRLVDWGYRNHCLIDGDLPSGKVGMATAWLSDAQLADWSTINPGIFTSISDVRVTERYPTADELTERRAA